MRRWALTAITVLMLPTGCVVHRDNPANENVSVAGRSDAELAKFLPSLADYPWSGWSVVQRTGPRAPDDDAPRPTVTPDRCDQEPFNDLQTIAAGTIANEINAGPTGFGGDASIRILRENTSRDLVADTRGWVSRCHNYVVHSPDSDPEYDAPTAVTLLTPTRVDGVDVLRVHLTDNRKHRFQTEGSRESVVSLARVRGVVVYGFAHDAGMAAEDVFATTIRRLQTDRPDPRPLSDRAGTDDLAVRTDAELSKLLPALPDMPKGLYVGQTSPVIDVTEENYQAETTTPAGCGVTPFMNDAPRLDIGRDFREVARATSSKKDTGYPIGGGPDSYGISDTESVWLNVEHPGTSVIDETKLWANRCSTYTGSAPDATTGSVELLPPLSIDGQEVLQIHHRRTLATNYNYRTLMAKVRGILVTSQPPDGQDAGPLFRKTIDNLMHATFDGPPPPATPVPKYDPNATPPGAVKLPAPSVESDHRLAEIAKGALVDSEQYHFGGYMPGDQLTRSPDYLHFRSPTGSLVCTAWKVALVCNVPQGQYPRTPKPVDGKAHWGDTYVSLTEWYGVENGIWAQYPQVYAESNVLPYGSTLRLADEPYVVECTMATDGLTCVNYSNKVGLHLSREDLTPLVGTDALAKDTRPEPK